MITHGQVVNIIASTANADGIPSWIPLDIASHESGLNPNSWSVDTNGRHSGGLFQLNRGGLGAGYSKSQLLNPTTNSQIAIGHMVPAYNTGKAKGLAGVNLLDYVANHSGWPDSRGVRYTNQVEPAYDIQLNSLYGSNSGFTAKSKLSLTPNLSTTAKNLESIDNAFSVQGWSITNPTKGFSAIGLRLGFFLIGIILIIFALYSVVSSAKGGLVKAVM